MTTTNPPRGPFVPFNLAYTAHPARPTGYGAQAFKAFQHLRNWRSAEMIAEYIGRPDVAVNGALVSKFHIITGSPPPADGTTRPLVFLIRNWYFDYWYHSGAGNEEWKWYDTIGGAVDTLFDETALQNGANDTYTGGLPTGRKHAFSVTYTPVAAAVNDGFKLHRLDAPRCLTHNLAVFSAPLSTQISDDQAITTAKDYSVGQTIKGYDTVAADPGTLAAILHYQQTGDSVVRNTRRCLFQTPYALSAYCEAAAWANIRGDQTYKVKGRNARGDDPCIADIAICATIDVPAGGDAGIRLRSSVAGDTWTYTTAADLATPTLITTSDGTVASGSAGLEYDPDGDEITVEAYADSGGHVKVHNVSLWWPLTISS